MSRLIMVGQTNVARVLCSIIGAVLLACAQVPTPTDSSIDNRERRVEETFACKGLNELLIYLSTGDLLADPATSSGFALSGEPIGGEQPGIVAAAVGVTQRLIVNDAPKVEGNYIRFYFAPHVIARIAEATKHIEDSRSSLTVHLVRDGEPVLTATVLVPLVDDSAELHLNHRNLQSPDEFIPTQQRVLCP